MSGRESLAGELTASLMVATGGRSSTTLQFTVSLPGGIHHEINHLDRISRQSSRSPRSWRWQFGYQKMMPRVKGAAASQGENPVHPRSDLIRGVIRNSGTAASESTKAPWNSRCPVPLKRLASRCIELSAGFKHAWAPPCTPMCTRARSGIRPTNGESR